MRHALELSLLIALFLLAGCPESEPTGIDVVVQIPGSLESLHELRVWGKAPNGFTPIQPPSSVATGVTVGTTADALLEVTFSKAGEFSFSATTVHFQIAMPNAAGQAIEFWAEGKVESGSQLFVAPNRTEGHRITTVVDGRMTNVTLEGECTKPDCVPADGGMAGNPTIDLAAHFRLVGGEGANGVDTRPLATVMVCHLFDKNVADLVVAAPQAASDFDGHPSQGRVLVYRGVGRTWSGELDLTLPDVTIMGHSYLERLGESVACADIDGDDHQDLLIGAPSVDDGAGRVYIVYSAGTVPKNSTIQVASSLGDGGVVLDGGVVAGVAVLHGPAAGGRAGAAIAAARLFESRPAVVIGAPETNGGSGAVYIVARDAVPAGTHLTLGGAETLTLVGSAGEKLGAALAGGPLGQALTTATRDDLVIGAPGASLSAAAAGAVYLLPASAIAGIPDGGTLDGGVLEPAMVRVIWGAAGSKFGEAVALGDLNHDGTLDLLLPAPWHVYKGRVNSGAVFVLEGGTLLFRDAVVDLSAATTPEQQRAIVGGPFGASAFGTSLVAVTSGTSSNADLWVGAPGWEGGRGLAALVKGSSGLEHDIDTGAEGVATFKVLGVTAGDRLGASVGAGSLEDGNTKADLVLVAPGAKGSGATTGAVGIVYGILDEVPK